jgi:hypothetical protein
VTTPERNVEQELLERSAIAADRIAGYCRRPGASLAGVEALCRSVAAAAQREREAGGTEGGGE